MQSLNDNFEKLRKRLNIGSGIRNVSNDPVFYLIFNPELMLEIKKLTNTWKSRLERDGYKVIVFSMKDAVHDIVQKSDLRSNFLEGDKADVFNFSDINESIKDLLLSKNGINHRLTELFLKQKGNKDVLVFITDLETLHPYLRVGAIEQNLQGKFSIPTIILYPGIREGNSLRFLGFYPPDGNYRSIHIGG